MNFPPYAKFPELQSSEIILRKIEIKDLQDILEISFYNAKPASSMKDAVEMQEKINKDYENGSSIHWGIVDKNTREIAGTLGYYRGFNNGTGELGFVLKAKFQGKGYMTKAVQLAVDFGFQEMGLRGIIAITTVENERAKALLERLNFRKTKDLQDGELEYRLNKSL